MKTSKASKASKVAFFQDRVQEAGNQNRSGTGSRVTIHLSPLYVLEEVEAVGKLSLLLQVPRPVGQPEAIKEEGGKASVPCADTIDGKFGSTKRLILAGLKMVRPSSSSTKHGLQPGSPIVE